MGASFDLSYNKEIQVPSKIRVGLLPSGIFLQTLDLENFATAYRSSKRVIKEGMLSELHRAVPCTTVVHCVHKYKQFLNLSLVRVRLVFVSL